MNITEVLRWFNDYFINCCVIYWVQCKVFTPLLHIWFHPCTDTAGHPCYIMCVSDVVSHTVSRLSVPEVWQQSVEAWVHCGSARGDSGVGLQGQIKQKARHRGAGTIGPAPNSQLLFFQSFLVQTCQNKLSFFGFLSFPPLAEDPSGNRAPDPVWDWQCHQWLVPCPYRDHQHTCEWKTQKLYL